MTVNEEALREVHRQLDDIIRMAQYAPSRTKLFEWCREEHQQRVKLVWLHEAKKTTRRRKA